MKSEPTSIKRKKRSDRLHIVYKVTNTVTAEIYIGITQRIGQACKRSVTERWKRHVSRALRNERDFTLCRSIREHGPENFRVEIYEKVRGKAEAHKRECELIHKLHPSLNMAST